MDKDYIIEEGKIYEKTLKGGQSDLIKDLEEQNIFLQERIEKNLAEIDVLKKLEQK